MKLLLLLSVLALAVIAFALFTPSGRDLARDFGDRVSQAIFGHMTRNGLVLGTYNFPEGTRFYFCSSANFAAAKTITALTNANPALATSTSHGYVDNDEIFLDSGWEDAKNAIYRVDQQDVNGFQVLGLNTSSTSFYPAGSGTGTAKKVGSWVQIPQVLGIQTSGGDPRFTQVSPLASRNSQNIPTGFNPSTTTLSLGHDPADVNWLAMVDISRTLTPVAFKMVLGGGGTTYGYGYMACNEQPQLNQNQVNAVSVVLSFQGRQISYST
ncbi:phage tail protein [Ramlibacter monticola]|uniref:Uncharacterized protein n=1 Tax=Ramlibacter monticola TaxID=1926872 RepID=A0A937CSF9_9BURK|nr:phage tail tube protein [Ramlibacter monticola]MBL0390529.1 hypothetical protein [Ramlibacter monticola]